MAKKSKGKPEVITEQEVMDANTKELKLLCNRLSLSSSGNKKTLQKRLLDHIEKLTADAEEEEAPVEEEVFEEEEQFEDEDMAIPTAAEIKKMKKADLVEMCELLDIETKGHSAKELRELLLEIMEEAEEDLDEEDEEEEEIEKEELPEPPKDLSLPKKDVSDVALPEIVDPDESLDEANYVRDVLGRIADSLTIYQALLKHTRDKDKKLTSKVLVQKGVAHQFLSDLPAAIACYVEAIKSEPKNTEARVLLDGARSIAQAQGISTGFDVGSDHVSAATPLQEKHQRLKGLLERMDGPSVTAQTQAPEQKRVSGPVEVPMTTGDPEPEPEPKPEPPKRKRVDAHTGKDEETIEEQEKIAEKLAKLREQIDLGSSGSSTKGAGLSSGSDDDDTKVDAGGPKGDFGDMLADLEKSRVEPPVEAIPVEDEEEPPEAEPVKEEPPEAAPVERDAPAMGMRDDIDGMSFGSKQMDEMVSGGFVKGNNFLVDAPPYVGKESILYHFARSCIQGGIPCVIVTTTDPIVQIRSQLATVCPELRKAEKDDLVVWIDPRSEEVQSKFTLAPSDVKKNKFLKKNILDLPDNYTTLIKSLISSVKGGKNKTFGLVVFSLTPLVSYQDPEVIEGLMASLSAMVKDMKGFGLYSLENDMHDDNEMGMVKKFMDGVIELKENPDLADKEHASLIRYSGGKKKGSSTKWTGFVVDDDGWYDIGW